MALILLDKMTLMTQAALLKGAGSGLTENAGISVDDIGGMPTAKAIVQAIRELDQALAAFSQLIDKDTKRIGTIATEFAKKDQSLSS